MDPNKLPLDSRWNEFCVFCAGTPDTRDHVPSKVLLDEPFPPDLPVVQSCKACNNSFSLDEEYLACFLECTIIGSVDPAALERQKVQRIMVKKPALATRIKASQKVDEAGRLVWEPELDRVRKVVQKLAQGHAAYEYGEIQVCEPTSIEIWPLATRSREAVSRFETPPEEHIYPEIGSRAFMRGVESNWPYMVAGWRNVQDGRYRYLVSHSKGILVRMVLGEYLACEVVW
ncbi:MAG TPA: hypothetical protein VGB92_13950 [Longimicrobium sp.]